MPSLSQSITVCYLAFNQSTKVGATGDVANHTLRLVKDGVSAAPTNAPAEVDATNAPGVYSLVLTTAEAGHNVVILCGKSSTANVTIAPVQTTFEMLPTPLPGTANGLPRLGANVGNTTFTGASLSQPGIKVDGLWLVNTNFGNPPLYIIDQYGQGGIGIDTSGGTNGPGIFITSAGHAIQITTATGKDVYHCTIGAGGLMFNPALTLAPTQSFNNTGQTTPLPTSGTGSGPGADKCTMTLTNSVTHQPLAGASVWITSDSAGQTTIAGALPTNLQGQVVFMLTAGVTYYLWMVASGQESINGQAFVAQAD